MQSVYGGNKPEFDTGEYGDNMFYFGYDLELKTQGTHNRTWRLKAISNYPTYSNCINIVLY